MESDGIIKETEKRRINKEEGESDDNNDCDDDEIKKYI